MAESTEFFYVSSRDNICIAGFCNKSHIHHDLQLATYNPKLFVTVFWLYATALLRGEVRLIETISLLNRVSIKKGVD